MKMSIIPNTCGACYYWDDEMLQVDLSEELESKVPKSMKNLGYCRLNPPSRCGLLNNWYDAWPVTRAVDWCGSNTKGPERADLDNFLERNPDLRPHSGFEQPSEEEDSDE